MSSYHFLFSSGVRKHIRIICSFNLMRFYVREEIFVCLFICPFRCSIFSQFNFVKLSFPQKYLSSFICSKTNRFSNYSRFFISKYLIHYFLYQSCQRFIYFISFPKEPAFVSVHLFYWLFVMFLIFTLSLYINT